jgi:DNA polymerase III subunit beta
MRHTRNPEQTMQFTAPVASLRTAVKTAERAVTKRTTIPILGFLHLSAEGGTLAIRATDLDRELIIRTPAAVTEPGQICVEAALLGSIVSKLPQKSDAIVALDSAKKQVTLRCESSRFVLHTLPMEDFPDLAPPPDSNHRFKLPTADLLRLIEATQFAISTEETRYYLNGIYLHQRDSGIDRALAAVTTDGHRLASAQVALPDGAAGFPSVIVHRETIRLIPAAVEGAETVEMTVAVGRVRFSTDAMTLTSKTIDGTFPDYMRVVPLSNDKLAQVETESLLRAADRVSTISSERGRAIKLDLDANSIRLSANNPDAGDSEETIEADYESAGLTIGFNSHYLNDIMAQVKTDTVDIMLANPGSPALFVPHGSVDSYFVLMPMRV